MRYLGVGSAGIICAAGLAFVYREKACSLIKSAIQKVATLSFYVGYKEVAPDIASKRRSDMLEKYKGEVFQCTNDKSLEIDAIYIPSQSNLKTGNVLILSLNTTYQDHNPYRWEPFLNNGADILLWNPTKLGAVSYSQDLCCILKCLRKKNPDQKIAIKTYCASSDPSISAVADQKDENMHLIIDRGHGDVCKLARSFTIFASLSIAQNALKEAFDCKGIEKIETIGGKILFLIPDQLDQVMDYGKKGNLTRDLCAVKPGHLVISLKAQDHWSDWTFTTYNQVLGFLSDSGVVNKAFTSVKEDQFPTSPPPTCFKKECVPILTKTCF